MNSFRAFYKVGIDNFGPVFAKTLITTKEGRRTKHGWPYIHLRHLKLFCKIRFQVLIHRHLLKF